ncbi:MAG: 50S ribosomal protein L23 [Candidatus Hodarchaeota archaeon]
MESHEIIIEPLVTEATFNEVEANNRVVFIVARKANKFQIKRAVQELFDVKVIKVNTLIGSDGRKKAFVKLDEESSAMDLASNLGMF